MEIINPGTTHLKRLTCDCGCSFEIHDEDFELTKTDVGFIKMVPCPDCHQTVFEPESLKKAVDRTIEKIKDECDYMYYRRYKSWWYKMRNREGKKK